MGVGWGIRGAACAPRCPGWFSRLGWCFVTILPWALVSCDREGPPSGGGPVEVVAAGYPRDIPLPEGGTLHLKAPPQSVVAASDRALDFLDALIGPSRIAAFPVQAIEYGTVKEGDPRYADHARFRVYAAEAVLALGPDLVVADPWQALDTHQRLREAGVPVLLLPSVKTWDDAREALALLGRVFQVSKRALQLIDDGNRRVAALKEKAKGQVRWRAVSYSNFGAKGFTAGAGTTVHEMLSLVGLQNAAAQQGLVGHGPLSFETLLRWDPDVIIVSEPLRDVAGHGGDRGGASLSVLQQSPSLAQLRAVRHQRLVSLPPHLFASASHNIVAGAEALALALQRLSPAAP